MEQALQRKMDLTYEDYLLTPEDQRHELIEGDLEMTPSPRTLHQIICVNLVVILKRYVEDKNPGRVLVGPTDVILSNTNVLVPDVLFVSKDREGIIQEAGVFGPPDLVVEVLSPSSRERDRVAKRRIYYKYGVKEYWIVDPMSKTVEVCVAGDKEFETYRVFSEGQKMKSPILAGYDAAVSDIFKK